MGSDLADDLRSWLDKTVEGRDPVRLALIPISAIVALGSVGIISDTRALLIAAVVGVIFVSLCVIAYEAMEVRRLRRSLAERNRVLYQLAEEMFVPRANSHVTRLWDQNISINENGDAVSERWQTIQVGESGMGWFSANFYKADQYAMSARDRSRVRASAYDVNGVKDVGVKLDTFESWTGNHCRMIVRFKDRLSANEVFTILVRLVWPGWFKELLAGDKDIMEWTSGTGAIDRLVATISFSSDCKVADRMRVTPHRGSLAPTLHKQSDGSLVIRAEYTNIEPQSPVGFTLDAAPL